MRDFRCFPCRATTHAVTLLVVGLLGCVDPSSTVVPPPPLSAPTPVPPVQKPAPPSPAPAVALRLLTPYSADAPLERRARDSVPSTLTIQLEDSLGQPVRQAGRSLRLRMVEADGVPSTRVHILRGGISSSDTAGIVRIADLVLAGRTGDVVIIATMDSLPTLSVPVRLLVGSVSDGSTLVSLAPDSVTVGGVADITVVPTDADGNKRGAGELVRAGLDGEPSIATVSDFAFLASDSSYRATVTVHAPSPARTLRVLVNGTTLAATRRLTGLAVPPPSPRPPVALKVVVAPGDTTPAYRTPSAAVWSSTTVQLLDADGTSVAQAGTAVSARLFAPNGAPLGNATLTGAAVQTNAAGRAVFPALAVTAPAGGARVRFESGALTPTGFAVQVLPGAVSAATSSFTTSRDTLIVDSTATLHLVPRDLSGSALGSGVLTAVNVGAGSSLGTISGLAYYASDSSYRGTYIAVAAGSTVALRAVVNGTLLTTSRPMTVIADPTRVSAESPVAVTPDSVAVGQTAHWVTTPLNAVGRKLGSGRTVHVALVGGTSTATVGTITYSPADSSYHALLTGVTSGTATTVTTTVNGVVLSATRLLTVNTAPPPPPPPPPVVATQLRITTLPGDTTSGGLDVPSGSLLGSITVSLRSAGGDPVAQAGVPITVTAVTAGGAVWTGATLTGAGPLTTGADGTVVFPAIRLSALAATGRIRLNASGLMATSLPVRVRAGAASGTTSSLLVTPSSVVVGATSLATVTLRDAQNNKLGSGQVVSLSLGSGSSGVTAGAVSFQAADSTYRATLTGTAAGTPRVVQATVAFVAITPTRTLTVTAPAVVADITATVNGGSTYPISRYIYGGNFINQGWDGAAPPVEMTFNRFGGNRSTAYNWENNYSNAGSDFNFQNDQFASSSTAPGAAIATAATPSFLRNQAFLVTIPMLGYVAGNACNCNVGTADASRATRLATHFKVSKAAKGAPFTTTPSSADAFVYQDEFVNWFEAAYPGRTTHSSAPVFFALDNEPDIWHATHKQIQSDLNDNPNTPRLQTYTGFSDTTVVYAKAIKAVLPNALIFGPATATYTGLQTLGRYPSPDPVYGTQNFLNVYLDRLRAASTSAGTRLLDVLDLHFYAQPARDIGNDYATQDSAMIQARVQAPRSLWDPTYNDGGWVTNAAGGPVRLIPRVRDQIAAHYPGTKIAVTEYFYGRGGDISGGIAQADVLGIFGREGVFAASIWPNGGIYASPYNGDASKAYAFVFGAFRMFLNYDGAGSAFGETGLAATTSNVALSSVYASRTSGGATVLVLINKATTPKVMRVTLTGVGAPAGAEVYVMQASSPSPTRQADLTLSGGALTYTMPALSVSTVKLTP